MRRYMRGWNVTVASDAAAPYKTLLLGALSGEIASFGVENDGFSGRLAAWLDWQDGAAAWQKSDPVLYARAVLGLATAPQYTASLVADQCWPTYVQSHGRALANLWFSAQYELAKAGRNGRALTAFEMHQIRIDKPVPATSQIGGYYCTIVNTCP